jgi:hypothetical protein
MERTLHLGLVLSVLLALTPGGAGQLLDNGKWSIKQHSRTVLFLLRDCNPEILHNTEARALAVKLCLKQLSYRTSCNFSLELQHPYLHDGAQAQRSPHALVRPSCKRSMHNQPHRPHQMLDSWAPDLLAEGCALQQQDHHKRYHPGMWT